MIQSFWTGASGLSSQQKNIDIIANNVANINTTGYRTERADFRDMVYNRMVNQVDMSDKMNLQHGTGTRLLQTNRVFSQGSIKETERPFDFAIQGNGFFNIEDGVDEETGDKKILYTRDGSFYVSPEEDGVFIVDKNGRYVLDDAGERIMITQEEAETASFEKLQVTPDGHLYIPGDEGQTIPLGGGEGIKLAVSDFINPAGLDPIEGTYFRPTANSGEAELIDEPNVRNHALEMSNVDYARETTRLIRAQRAFQFASRAVNTADQMAGLANSIRQ